MQQFGNLQSIAPAYFVVPDDVRTVVISQSHRKEPIGKGTGPKDYWARMTVQPDGDRVLINLGTKEGRYQEQQSYLTLTSAQAQLLSEHLLKAAKEVEEYTAEHATV